VFTPPSYIQVPELSSIHTLIDLELGKLFIESPKCKDKLHISLLEYLTHLSAELDIYGQRYGCLVFQLLTNWFLVFQLPYLLG
jgi:molybdenum cofactor sulfurtransferase